MECIYCGRIISITLTNGKYPPRHTITKHSTPKIPVGRHAIAVSLSSLFKAGNNTKETALITVVTIETSEYANE